MIREGCFWKWKVIEGDLGECSEIFLETEVEFDHTCSSLGKMRLSRPGHCAL